MGRNKSYNEDVVLEKAMYSFWKHGYDQLSIRQLEKDMGINQFSIYSSFQSKENLFLLVLEKYKQFIEANYLKSMNREGASIQDISHFLLNFSTSIQSGKIPNGCLMVNSTSELSNEQSAGYRIIKAYFSTIQEAFKKVLRHEVSNGNIAADIDINGTSLFLLGVAQSISIMAKVKSKKEIKAYVEFAMRMVK